MTVPYHLGTVPAFMSCLLSCQNLESANLQVGPVVGAIPGRYRMHMKLVCTALRFVHTE
jgi:hypothetical protein